MATEAHMVGKRVVHILLECFLVKLFLQDLESEVMRGLASIPTGSNIFHWIFLFSHSTASDANICIIANFV